MPIKLLKFLTEIAMQFIFMFLELVPAIDFVKSPHLKVIVLYLKWNWDKGCKLYEDKDEVKENQTQAGFILCSLKLNRVA